MTQLLSSARPTRTNAYLIISGAVIIGVMYGLQAAAWALHPCGVRLQSLTTMVRFEDVEAERALNRVPPGFVDDQWEAFVANRTIADTLWAFSDIGFLSGSQGDVLVRMGMPVACMTERYF